jgi:hypothetical protein
VPWKGLFLQVQIWLHLFFSFCDSWLASSLAWSFS